MAVHISGIKTSQNAKILSKSVNYMVREALESSRVPNNDKKFLYLNF